MLWRCMCILGVYSSFVYSDESVPNTKRAQHALFNMTAREVVDDGYLSLKEFVELTFPELLILLPQKSTEREMIKSLSDIIQAIERPNPDSLKDLAAAIEFLSKMKPETLDKLLLKIPSKNEKSIALMKNLVELKKQSTQQLTDTLKNSGKYSESERLIAYYALIERLGKQKLTVSAIIAKEAVENTRKLIPKMTKDLAPIVQKHKAAFLNGDKNGKEAFMKDLEKSIIEWDKKNGNQFSKLLDPNASKDLIQVLKQAQKQAGLPPVELRLYLPNAEMERLYGLMINEITSPIVQEIREKARREALASVAQQRMPGRIRAGANAGAPQGAEEGALDGAFGRPKQGPRATGRVHVLLGRDNNYGYGVNRGWNEAYEQSYALASQQRTAEENELRIGVKTAVENLVNENLSDSSKLSIYYMDENAKVTGGQNRPDYSYLAFHDDKRTFATFKLELVDEAVKPVPGGKSLVERIIAGEKLGTIAGRGF